MTVVLAGQRPTQNLSNAKNNTKKLYTLLRIQLYTLLRIVLYTIVRNIHLIRVNNFIGFGISVIGAILK
jgi:hypothetical protein